MKSIPSLAILVAVVAAGALPAGAASNDPASTERVTFTRDVLPILQEKCQACHRPQGLNLGGMVAPMSLLDYDEARPWAKSIARVVRNGEMPPWHAAESQRGLFKDERYLEEEEIETLVRWATTGAARGNPEDAPEPLEFPDNGGWAIGEPDLIIKMPVDFVVEDEVEDLYQTFRHSLSEEQLPEDRWVKAVEFKPTGSFVHHIILRPIGGIAPGYQPRVYEPGRSVKLRTGTELSWQMHYHKEPGPGTSVVDDATYVALKFYEPGEVIRHIVRSEPLGIFDFRIPPGDGNYSAETEHTFEKDVYITGFNPHMHLRGKAAKIVGIFSDGREQLLLEVPEYDFNWQHTYLYKEPVFMPAGSKVHMTLWWDNSPENEDNPDPTAEVRWGRPTTAEMGFGWMKYVDAEPVHIVVGSEETATPTGGGK